MAQAPPHILFILADDLGHNDVSYHNHNSGPGATWTPKIDSLANASTVLESYYTNPICSPSRASIMTGRYTIRTGINHHCYETAQMTGLPQNERLMPLALREAGYETWFFGKVCEARGVVWPHRAKCGQEMGQSWAH